MGNALGEASASTQVKKTAKPAQFTSAADGTDMNKYVLEWVVISHSEVAECNIRFKIDDNSKEWMFITANVKKVEPDTYVGKVTLEHLKPGSRYVVQIASKMQMTTITSVKALCLPPRVIQTRKTWRKICFQKMNTYKNMKLMGSKKKEVE